MRVVIIIWVLLSCLDVFGQRIRFSQINIKSGLSQSTVRAVVQDNQGFVWLGTEDGLNKFDGLEMQVYNTLSEEDYVILKDNYISSLLLDANNTLWIGTREGGITTIAASGKATVIQYDSSTSEGLMSQQINKIVEYNNSIYVCSDAGLDRFNNSGVHEEQIWSSDNAGDLSVDIHDLAFINGNIMMASTGSGLIVLDANGRGKSIIPLDEDGAMARKNLDKLRSILVDSHNRIWLGYYGGGLALSDTDFNIHLFDYKNSDEAFPGRAVNEIFEDHTNTIWFATNKGLASYNEDRMNFRFLLADEDDPLSIADNNVYAIFEDEANSIWAGTQLGASVYHRTLGNFNHIKYDKGSDFALKNSKKVYAFGEDDIGNIWIGTDGGGISRFNFIKEEVNHYLKEENNVHNSILAIHGFNGNVWFGSYGGGIGAYLADSAGFIKAKGTDIGLPSSTVLSLHNDGDVLLVGTYKGLAKYWYREDSVEVYKENLVIKSSDGEESWLVGGQIHCITQVDGKFWLGTQNGISIFDSKRNHFQNINEDQGLSNTEVYSIAIDSKGVVWVGTSGGLFEISGTGEVLNAYTTQDGLGSNFIYGVLVDKNNGLWLSTNNGLTLFKPYVRIEPDNTIFVRHYNEVDGLQADEFNQGAYFMTSEDELFFGGVNGFNHFFSRNIVDNNHAPKLVLKSFKLFDQIKDMSEFLNEDNIFEFTYKQNYLEFEFAGLDYVLPDKNTYQFMLEGVDDAWSDATSYNKVSYKDLKPGDYVLKVRAFNNDGIPSDEVYEIKFTIIPPFWQTTWFYIVCAVTLILGIVIFVRLRMRKIKIEKKNLEEKVEERTAELAAKTDELEEKNTEIVDSINYAEKIQSAILPDLKVISEHLKDSFVLYLPKDIVSGDFYWFGVRDGKKIITAVDCTGHGVPGAFMSMIGSNLLNQIVLEKGICNAGEILSNLNKGVQAALKQGTDSQETNDGMDISLCVIDDVNMKLEWAGAYNPLYHFRGEELTKLKADKFPIGGAHMQMDRDYKTHEIDLREGDVLYMFSDGYVDQFGGEKGKKFMGKRFQQTLADIRDRPMSEQKEILNQVLDAWMGQHEQIDDVCVVGVRV